MRIDDILQKYLQEVVPSDVRDAMEYSLMASGKRIRPNLLYEILKGYGFNEEKGDRFAAAIEMIHTYSLIHDDLPDMDNDDLRRGRPTCHKQFDPATAILAGDGLLTQAFACAAETEESPAIVLKGISILAEMAGANGMVYGQNLDMRETINHADWEYLKRVHYFKTGCLLSAPLMIGAVLSHQDDNVIDRWKAAGVKLGLAFQIQDDILDVELSPEDFGKSNSDERNGKVTSVTLLGIEDAEKMMRDLYAQVKQEMQSFSGFNATALTDMVDMISERRK